MKAQQHLHDTKSSRQDTMNLSHPLSPSKNADSQHVWLRHSFQTPMLQKENSPSFDVVPSFTLRTI